MLSTYMSTEYSSERNAATASQTLAVLKAGAGLTILTVDAEGPTTEVSHGVIAALPAGTRVALIDNPRQGLLGFLLGTCAAFGVPLPAEDHSIASLVAALRAFLDTHREQHPLLVVNEAQSAPFYVLWQLLSLSATGSDWHRPLQVLLIGRPSLLDGLKNKEMAPVVARIDAQFQLSQWVHHPQGGPVSAPMPMAAAADAINLDLDTAASPIPTAPVLTAPAPVASPASAVDPVRSLDIPMPQASGRRPTLWLAAAGLVLAAVAAWVFLPGRNDATPVQAQAPQPVPAPPAQAAMPAPVPAPTATAEPAVPDTTATTAPAVSVAAAPVAPTPEPASPSPPPAFADLVDDASATWGVLASQWDAKLAAKDPCTEALAQQLQCYRRPDMTLELLRQLDRPGLVKLTADGVTRWVHLQAMDSQSVTLFSSGKTWTLPLAEFGKQWSGAYSTLWRLPPQQSGQVFTATPTTPAGQWLDQQLKAMQANGKLAATEDSLAARVTALQRAQQWPTDGKALPTVLLLVNRLTDVPEPRLMSGTPKK